MLSTLLLDIKLQWKNGFYAAALFVTLIWIVLLRLTPIDLVPHFITFLIFSNLQISGFYFMAGIRLLEKDEGTLTSQLLTPLPIWQYLSSKMISLTLITLIESTALIYFGLADQAFPVFAVVGVISMSCIFILCGLISIDYFKSLNGFLLPSVFIAFVLFLPIFNLFETFDYWFFNLHPMQGPLLLLQLSIEQEGDVRSWMFALISSVIVIGLLFLFAKKRISQISGEGV